jgi:hypothetical protein
MNTFFQKGIDIANYVLTKTNDTQAALDVLEHTCDMCKSNCPCDLCPVNGKKEELKTRPFWKETAAASEPEIIIEKHRKTTTTVTVVEETEVYHIINGQRWLKYTRKGGR